jgi:hypothetical protein
MPLAEKQKSSILEYLQGQDKNSFWQGLFLPRRDCAAAAVDGKNF